MQNASQLGCQKTLECLIFWILLMHGALATVKFDKTDVQFSWECWIFWEVDVRGAEARVAFMFQNSNATLGSGAAR